MATPPFNLDISDPADGTIGQTFPQNERNFRDQVNSYINTDHDPVTGHHAFPLLTTAQIAALTTPPSGMVVVDTTLSLLKVNIGTPSAPVWLAVGPGIGGFHYALFSPSGGANQGFTLPVPSIKVTAVAGGGGGGGGGWATGGYGGGGGGGSGAVVISAYTGLTIGGTITINCGSHGLGGTGAASGAATAGTAGGSTTVTSGTMAISSIVATGGQPGQPGSSTGGGTGGLGGMGSSGPPGAFIQSGSNGYPGAFAGVAGGVADGGDFGLIASSLGINGSGGIGGPASNTGAANGAIGFDGYVLIEWIQ